jgi:hypothetical protein
LKCREKKPNHIDILQHLRPLQTPHPALHLKHPLHPPLHTTRPALQTHRSLHITIHEIHSTPTNTSLLDFDSPNNPPHNRPLPPLSRPLPLARLSPTTHPTIPTLPPRPPPHPPHHNLSPHNPPSLPLPPLNRTHTLDRAALRQRVRTSSVSSGKFAG